MQIVFMPLFTCGNCQHSHSRAASSGLCANLNLSVAVPGQFGYGAGLYFRGVDITLRSRVDTDLESGIYLPAQTSQLEAARAIKTFDTLKPNFATAPKPSDHFRTSRE